MTPHNTQTEFSRETNWFQDLSSPLPALQPTETQTPAQAARVNFYRTMLQHTRLIGGCVNVAVVPKTEHPVAVVCWLPPKRRPTLLSLWQSGWLSSWLGFGFLGLYRLLKYMYGIEAFYKRLTTPMGCRGRDGGFVAIVGTDTNYAGHGYARMLLQWQIQQHRRQFPGLPVFLDTSTDYGQRVYEKLEFRELGRKHTALNVDGEGFRRDVANGESYLQDRTLHSSRIMIRDLDDEVVRMKSI